MTALVFVDTNVLVYARDPRDPIKQAKAREWIRFLWDEQRGRTSVQVLSEYYDVITRKFRPAVSRETTPGMTFNPISPGIRNRLTPKS